MIAPEAYLRYAAYLFSLLPEELRQDKRSARHCRARFALYAAHEMRARRAGERPSPVAIGRLVGRDHSTVCSGLRRAAYIAERDEAFREAVEKIASLTAEVYESACKHRLPLLPEEHQPTRRSEMDHPEYTEHCVNAALKAAKITDIEVWWDGRPYDSEDAPSFRVYVDGDETSYWVADDRRHFVIQSVDGLKVDEIDTAKTYEGLAAKLAEIVKQTEVA